MSDAYVPADHYWRVLDPGRLWSSARRAYVGDDDKAYVAWRERGGLTTRISNEDELWDVLAEQAPEKLPDDAAAQERRRERMLGNVDPGMMKALLGQENRLRALEGKGPVTALEFRDALKTGW